MRTLAANDPFRLAGATAFFTSFALPPIIMILVRVLGIFLDRRALGKAFEGQLSGLFGNESTENILKVIGSFRALQLNYLATISLFIFLTFVATTLFRVIKNSINQIWKIKKRKGNIGVSLKSRGLSLVVIFLGGLLFLGVQVFDAGQQMFGEHTITLFPNATRVVSEVLNELLIMILSAGWFFALFVLLPDGKVGTRTTLLGAIITSILFNAGKWLLQILLQPVKLQNFYGASGAVVLVLLFVFYSSLILYAGTAFIKAWAEFHGTPIRPRPYAVNYRIEETEE